MKEKLESNAVYDTIRTEQDCIKLLKLMRGITYNYELQKYPFLALHAALKRYYSHYQKCHSSNNTYMESFMNMSEVVEYCGGTIGCHRGLIRYLIKQ